MADVHEVTVIYKNLDEYLNDDEKEHVTQLVTNFCLKISRQEEIERIEISSTTQKNPTGEISTFQITAQLRFFSGEHLVAHAGGRDIEPAIKESLKRLEKQERRKHQQKIGH
jgi:ribosome-associated translation inhibitor RaiA